MEEFELIIPTLFGMETFVVRELKKLGYENTSVEDGRVTFRGGYEAICRANIWLRTGERVLIKAGEFTALTFDELFEKTKSIDWSRWIPQNGAFPVKGYCLKSQLASMRDCQAIIKKAVAESLSESYGISWLPEDEETYQLQFSVMKDRVTLMIDTSGDGLHKRGYRRIANAAPLKETIAAAMVTLSYWKFEYPLADPFCGSGTIPIEAAMFKRNIAPGLTRNFSSQNFRYIPDRLWSDAREEALNLKREIPLEIYASDIDASAVEIAAENAKLAGVGDAVKPITAKAENFSSEKSYGSIICNPPYGERLSDAASCEKLYAEMGKTFSKLKDWSYYIIASNENFEKHFGRRADKKRKLYNGMIKCNIYQFFGKRPPKN
jgi:putative N6-adenine-specific DNA methylase